MIQESHFERIGSLAERRRMDPSWQPRLFVYGDSISIQYGPHLKRMLEGKIRYDRITDNPGEVALADLNRPIGANGGDTNRAVGYMRRRHRDDPIPADILMINCGLHDLKTDLETGQKQVPLCHYVKNLRQILELAEAMNLVVIWVRITPVMDEVHDAVQPVLSQRFAHDVDAYNKEADQVMLSAKVPVLDLYGFSSHFVPAGYKDHVHYKDEVCALQAAYLAGAIEMLLR
ncbi:SGNH/GDSL hydrolase family protein [Ruficoccus sp. ZRK36]|uniref:SGNH/GDSL hydrolase family protein n=1 Tax=Ruficoccus sp. ZRK36 TaxID=2866311 RepID=UPI001C73811B|nr:SGNH/GDSL hydrolase family protein [Ruficoccus sp. ZRK36]QYY37233.1 SGNH/GDSL hydrolase family protein [Ruficoccus sp. ZRK36]